MTTSIYRLTRKENLSDAKSVPVRLGVFYNEFVEVHGDLRPDEIVVTEGNERLSEGRNVRIVNFSELSRNDSAGSQADKAQAR